MKTKSESQKLREQALSMITIEDRQCAEIFGTLEAEIQEKIQEILKAQSAS